MLAVADAAQEARTRGLLQLWQPHANGQPLGTLSAEADDGRTLGETPVVTADHDFGDWQSGRSSPSGSGGSRARPRPLPHRGPGPCLPGLDRRRPPRARGATARLRGGPQPEHPRAGERIAGARRQRHRGRLQLPRRRAPRRRDAALAQLDGDQRARRLARERAGTAREVGVPLPRLQGADGAERRRLPLRSGDRRGARRRGRRSCALPVQRARSRRRRAIPRRRRRRVRGVGDRHG